MKNYSPINDNKDIITKEYADSNYTTLATEQSISGIKRFTNENGIYINRIHNINGNAVYDFDGTNVRFGGLTRPLHFRGSLERPKYTTGDGTTFQDIAFVSDIPTSINGLSGGTLTSPLVITGGDGAGASKIALNQAGNGQITDNSTSTIFGFISSTILTVGSNSYALALRGSGERPTYKGADLALKSDIPTIDTSNLAKLNAENTFTETQTVKRASGNSQSKIFPNYFYSSDGTNYSMYKPDGIQFKTAILSFPTTTGTLALTSDIDNCAKLDTENTFTKGQTITGSKDGYSLNASGYVKGSWLQSQTKSNKGSNTGMVCVFDSAGWIYYRTPSEILSEAGGITSSELTAHANTVASQTTFGHIKLYVDSDTLYIKTT